METYIEKLKNTLYELIHETSANYWLYTADPKRDFIGNPEVKEPAVPSQSQPF